MCVQQRTELLHCSPATSTRQHWLQPTNWCKSRHRACNLSLILGNRGLIVGCCACEYNRCLQSLCDQAACCPRHSCYRRTVRYHHCCSLAAARKNLCRIHCACCHSKSKLSHDPSIVCIGCPGSTLCICIGIVSINPLRMQLKFAWLHRRTYLLRTLRVCFRNNPANVGTCIIDLFNLIW